MLSSKLRQLRIKKKVSQREVAKAIYVSNSSISHYEKNRCKPSRDTIEALAKYYNVSIDYLLNSTNKCSIEQIMEQEYCGDLTVGELIEKCILIDKENRETIIAVVNALAQPKT